MEVGEVLARYKPTETSVRVLMDGSIQFEIEETTRRLAQARRDEAGLRSAVPGIQEELDKLQVRAEEATVTFKMAAIPGKDFDRLKYENPPTEADWNRYRSTQEANPSLALLGRIGVPEFNFEGFIARLIGLSISEVDGESVDWSEDDGLELWASLHDGARSVLSDAVWNVNGERSSRPLSATATGTTSSSGSGSTTPADKGSPTPDS